VQVDLYTTGCCEPAAPGPPLAAAAKTASKREIRRHQANNRKFIVRRCASAPARPGNELLEKF